MLIEFRLDDAKKPKKMQPGGPMSNEYFIGIVGHAARISRLCKLVQLYSRELYEFIYELNPMN